MLYISDNLKHFVIHNYITKDTWIYQQVHLQMESTLFFDTRINHAMLRCFILYLLNVEQE